MELKDARILVVGGAGFIGSFVVSELLKHEVAEVIVYDNLARGKLSNLGQQIMCARPRRAVGPNQFVVESVRCVCGEVHGQVLWAASENAEECTEGVHLAQ